MLIERLGPEDWQLVAPFRKGGVAMIATSLSAEGASRFVPALLASGPLEGSFPALRAAPDRLLTAGPSDLKQGFL